MEGMKVNLIPALLDLLLFGNRHAYNGNISKQALKALEIFRPIQTHHCCSRRACGKEKKRKGTAITHKV